MASFNPIVSEEDLNKFKVLMCINTVGQRTLLNVYKYYKRSPDTVSIKDHLMNDFHLTLDQVTSSFDATMNQVIASTPASGKAYDISLLIKCLRILSKRYGVNERNWFDKRARELEYKCQKLVDKRNQVFHTFSGISSSEMEDDIDEIHTLIDDILSSLDNRFTGNSIEIAKFRSDVKSDISQIRSQDLENVAIRFYKQFQSFMNEIPALKDSIRSWGLVQILEFLSVSPETHNIKLLFTDVIVEKHTKFNKNISVNCKDIISMVSESSILLLDSEAGGGKTTIIQYDVNDWCDGGTETNTGMYQFLFPMVFRNPYICSVVDLIRNLMPKVRSDNMGDKDVLKCLEDSSMNILFLCDGFDESNENSKKLFDEIISLKEKHAHIKVAVTSRPEAVRQLHDTSGSKLDIDHLKVKGIRKDKQCEFLKKYHDELIKAHISEQSTDDLLKVFEAFSERHKELFRLPLNLAILSWLWGQNSQLTKTIKSAAGLYSATLDILKDKAYNRVIDKTSVQGKAHRKFHNELSTLIDNFEKQLFRVSLNALRDEQVYIDPSGSDSLMNVCKDMDKLFFEELKGAFLLTKLKWNIILEETLEFPHKGFLDFYAAKCIESKIINEGKRVELILIELYNNDPVQLYSKLSKYQNVLQILGGILAMKDPTLVDEHGPDIINLLEETGISNNTQWYDVYSDLNVNPRAAKEFAILIAPHLDLSDLTITEANVDILSTLLQYVDVNEVEIDINTTSMPAELPSLISYLLNKDCKITILKIADEQAELWDSSTTPFDKINIIEIDILKDNHPYIKFLSRCKNIQFCYLRQFFRGCKSSSSINISGCNVDKLMTAVTDIQQLPTSVTSLYLGILTDIVTGEALDPGIANIKHRLPGLTDLRIHLKPGTSTHHLPRLPDGIRTRLYYSHLNTEDDIRWAVETATTLQPTSGYCSLWLPSCGLSCEQLVRLLQQCSVAGITMRGGGDVFVSSSHSSSEKDELERATYSALNCVLRWYDDDDGFNKYSDRW